METEFTKARRFPRFPRACTVLYSSELGSGVAHLCDISNGGLGVTGLSPGVTTGAEIPVTVSMGLNRVGPLAARVVWSRSGRAGLELDWDDPAVACRIAQALRYLEPL